MPPITTVANGRCTSEPAPTLNAIGIKPEACSKSRDQNRPQTSQGTLPRGILRIEAILTQVADERNHHDPEPPCTTPISTPTLPIPECRLAMPTLWSYRARRQLSAHASKSLTAYLT